jgi:hypothetical protein
MNPMSFLERIVGDLREKRLWPLAVVLLAALVAVPVLLSKGSSSTPPVAQAPAASQSAAPTGLPVVSSTSAPSGGKLKGSTRNPFNQLVHGAATGVASAISATTGTSTTAGSSGTNSTSGSGSSSSGSSTSSSSTSTTTTTTTTTTTIPTETPKPAPPGLKATQSYDVKLAITNSAGGVDTINPLERLSVLPSNKQPLLIELGVLKGGNRVLFAVQPGAVVSGAGTCVPGPIDCEILSLPQDQTVTLGTQSTGGIQTVALFAVTGISAADHSSVAAANEARRAESQAGRTLLNSSTATALSLFHYDPGLGALVDLRNLTVGG